MGPLIRAFTVAIATVIACSGCGIHLTSGTDRSGPAPDASPNLPDPPRMAPEPFADPQPDVRQKAIEFVRSSLTYDSATEDRTSFLHRVRLVVTPAELIRLQQSERAQLNWSVLQQRRERVTLKVTGASLQTSNSVPVLVVEGVRTTKTAFATIRDLVEVIVSFEASEDGLLVSSAAGGGL